MMDPIVTANVIDSPARESLKNADNSCYSRNLFKSSSFSKSRFGFQPSADKFSRTLRSVRNTLGYLSQVIVDVPTQGYWPETSADRQQSSVEAVLLAFCLQSANLLHVLNNDDIKQHGIGGRRRHRLTETGSPCRTPSTPASKIPTKQVLGRSPARLYSPFGIETPHCNDYRMSPYMPDTPEHGLSPKGRGIPRSWNLLSKKRPRALFN